MKGTNNYSIFSGWLQSLPNIERHEIVVTKAGHLMFYVYLSKSKCTTQ